MKKFNLLAGLALLATIGTAFSVYVFGDLTAGYVGDVVDNGKIVVDVDLSKLGTLTVTFAKKNACVKYGETAPDTYIEETPIVTEAGSQEFVLSDDSNYEAFNVKAVYTPAENCDELPLQINIRFDYEISFSNDLCLEPSAFGESYNEQSQSFLVVGADLFGEFIDVGNSKLELEGSISLNSEWFKSSIPFDGFDDALSKRTSLEETNITSAIRYIHIDDNGNSIFQRQDIQILEVC